MELGFSPQSGRQGEFLTREGHGVGGQLAGTDILGGHAGLDADLGLAVEQVELTEVDGGLYHLAAVDFEVGGGFDDDGVSLGSRGIFSLRGILCGSTDGIPDRTSDREPYRAVIRDGHPDAAVDQGFPAQRLHHGNCHGELCPLGRAHALSPRYHVVGTDTQNHGVYAVHVVGLDTVEGGVVGVHFRAAIQRDADGVPLLFQGSGVKIHGGRTHKTCHEEVFGVVVEVLRCVDLLDEAPLHDHDAAAHGHGLHLVVGNVDEGGAQPLVESGDLGAHDPAELGIQIGQGLVQKEHLGAPHDGAAEGDTLALTARQGAGLTLQKLGNAQNTGGLGDLFVDDILGYFGCFEGEGQVLVDRHVGVQGVVLEHHGNVPIPGLYVVDDDPVDAQLPCRNILQSCDHAQGGGFSASRRAHEYNEFLVLYLHVEVAHGLCGTVVDLVDVLEGETCHRVCSFDHVNFGGQLYKFGFIALR